MQGIQSMLQDKERKPARTHAEACTYLRNDIVPCLHANYLKVGVHIRPHVNLLQLCKFLSLAAPCIEDPTGKHAVLRFL